MNTSTVVLTQSTARKVITDSDKVAELGARYHGQGDTLRRVLFGEMVEWIAEAYEGKATAKENGKALNDTLALVVADIKAANPDTVKKGYNAKKRADGNGYNPIDNTLVLYWAPGSDSPSWTASASREVRAIREALAQDGHIDKLARAWSKRKNWTPKHDNATPPSKHEALLIKRIKAEGLTRAEVGELIIALNKIVAKRAA